MKALLKNNKMYSWEFNGKRYDIGTMKDWFNHIELSAKSDFSSTILKEVLKNL